MKIHRIRLKNYRGIADLVVDPDVAGVTVVEGPNEIGKSSFVEAVDLILNHPDSTSKHAVRSVQPYGRDVGPEIEVELEIGPHRFSYWKRFLRKPETVLTLIAPKAEKLVGREAHDRAREILAEALDTDLWKALCVMQDERADQVDLSKASALAQALDQTAGGEVASDREQSLFDAVHEEHAVYFTDGGNPRKPLTEAAEAVEGLNSEVHGLEDDLNSVQVLADVSAQLERDIKDLTAAATQAKHAAALREAAVEEVEKQEERVRGLQQTWRLAASVEDRLAQDESARRILIQKVGDAEAEVEKLREKQTHETPAVGEALELQEAARLKFAEAKQAAEQAARLVGLRTADVEYHDDQLQLELLQERKERIEEWRGKKDAAAEVMQRCQVNEKLLERLRKANVKLAGAQAQLDAGSPKVRVLARHDVTVELDGEPRTLSAGACFEETVGSRRTLRVADLVEVEVVAGTSLDDLVENRDGAQKQLQNLLRQGEAATLGDAERAYLERRDAEQCVEAAVLAIQTDLRDLTYQDMLEKIGRLEARLATHPPDVSRPATPEAAKLAKVAAEEERDLADRAVRAAESRHVAAVDRSRELAVESDKTSYALTVKSESWQSLLTELAAARERKADAPLVQEREAARQQAGQAKHAWDLAREALERTDPQLVRDLGNNSRKAAERLARDLREKEDEHNAVEAKLDLLGGQGIFDTLEDARRRLEHASDHLRTVHRRADAARLLYACMKQHRDDARRAYATPLREKIVQLGRYLFDASFDVELDEKLAISTRSLGGVLLPFESLSLGAREQLGLIVRLACSLLVDAQDGVPLIFDDTLGHTDPGRLEGMGAMLSHAGERCQIIILTCTPGRFRHIGQARTIRLDSPGAAGVA